MISTIERGNLLSRSSSMTSPLSFKRELTPQSISDPALLHIHDRLSQLDSRVLDLRASVLTKDAYVDRRNREDESLRREFESHRSLTSNIETVVGKTKADVSQIKTDFLQLRTEILQLRTHVGQLGSKEAFLHSDVSQLQNDVNQIQLDVQRLHTNVCATRTDLSQIQAIVSQIRIDLMTLERETSRHFGDISARFSKMESRMNHTERVRFNSLAHTVHAPITPVPVVETDGSVRWPDYFPRSVWKFWCLKRRSRIHRLVELAEFYQLEGFQYWGRMPHRHDAMIPGDGYMSDSSDSSDLPSDLTLAEAARLYPEACHQALAATLGLVYYKIRNEVGEGPTQHIMPATQKRLREDVASNNSAKQKQPKLSRRPNDISPPSLARIVARGAAIDAKSIVSEGLDKLGWNVNTSQMSDETLTKLKDLVTDEVNSLLLRALERGNIQIQPSRMEFHNNFLSGSAGVSVKSKSNASDDDMQTVPTEVISPISEQEDPQWANDQILEAGCH
ncbi:hypothetical protein LOZ12_005812 [Ophidiomyces ophidiicola]|uniref:Uncharacterized protein n=1 Tax=Ophidiomyces ophidiicola TaxID=1387563 RepID=A0ACB8UW20_9EURO|nr:hypothetical protein LOZ59_004221 [Ophidiomyces ophidiicola]KAI2000367.1 hypothetical protein LOZ50_005972 [Ophidiomyces ophidiicola]KAI2050829.1 hypothetical protein LOZ38_003061 [Ophidiomyces ophidiicola]KAI2068713.1 hypothetical protein LOZ40_002645 [Ophidiomyces ophidiicola]KAI2079803.1 hypothetical protein LOZ37_001813 [Ophidiomyces ophidiicola]